MTAIELSAYINLELDESGTPDLNDTEMSHFINVSLFDFRTRELPNYEKNEWTRRALLPLRVEVTPPASDVITTSNYADFTVCVELAGEFTDLCTNAKKWQPIVSLRDDTEYSLKNDPFGSATNLEPRYKTYNESGINKIKILSETPPSSIVMAYLRQFNNVDLSTSPNAVVDYDPLLTHQAIGLLAVIRILSVYQDPRFSVKIYEDRYASLTNKIQ